ncbi:MAG TPA: type II toxin-antitoxin system RelE/ParE family toxin [Trueperaceae bacterium]|nr:type II toxin-antitoxin system RelE/ParE family toxin [Trueperaceae bacterium]
MRSVLLTDGAARDLDEWYAAAYARGGAAEATQILDRIEVVLDSLAKGSLREESLPELRPLGKLAERQVVTDGGLRVVFRAGDERVLILMIAPVKRSFQALLERRLLDA